MQKLIGESGNEVCKLKSDEALSLVGSTGLQHLALDTGEDMDSGVFSGRKNQLCDKSA